MTTPREGHTATLRGGVVLIAGGVNGNLDTSSSAELYEPATGIFRASSHSMTVPRWGHTATLLPHGRVLIAGGGDNNQIHSSAELYADVFVATGSMMTRRVGHTATLLPDGKVLITGGYNDTEGALSSAEIYVLMTETFSPPSPSDYYYSLTVSKAGAGSGVVTSTPSGLDCGPTCQATFPRYSEVTLHASPSPGSIFVGWGIGGSLGTDPSFTVVLGWPTGVLATFEVQRSLTVIKEGAGTGVVTSTPSGVDCGSTCQATYLTGTRVTLYASPSSGSNFVGWSGDGCSGPYPSCTVTIAADTTVVANFEPQKTLTVTKAGAGSGLVTSTPSGIDCGLTCQATFPPTVTLHASPSSGSYFAGWSGGGCLGTASLCTVTMTADTTVTADFEIYIPGALMTVARSNHTATLLPNGKVLLAGGWDSTYNRLPSIELYDPGTATFAPTGSMGTGRVGHTATLLPNGKVLLAGGEESSNPTSCSSAELYDPITGTVNWAHSGSGDMLGIHAWHTATFFTGPGYPNGTVLLTGGFTVPDYCDSVAELYEPTLDLFSILENPYMTSELAGHTATLLSNKTVLIAGGYDSNGTILNSAEIYDPTTVQGFFVTGSMTTRREGHTATLLPEGKVLVVGGWGTDDVPRSSWELYDPATGMFSTSGSMAIARADHTATLLLNGKVLIAGGWYTSHTTDSSAELYDPATGAFATTGSMTTDRAGHTATRLTNGKVLIVGGYSDVDGVLSSAEIYDPETGTFSANVPINNPSYSLRITKAGAGSGAVTSTPPGVDCGSTCQAAFPSGTMVTLQASGSSGSYFAGWSGGGCSGTNLSCTITLSADTTVVAAYELQKTLTITKEGAGSGLVTSTPSGVDCGSTCQASFIPGTVVTLQASASSGSYFAGWSGGGCSGTAPSCTVTITVDTTVVATFQHLNTLTVSNINLQYGLVTSTPSGVNCGYTCQATYTPGTMITLQAVPSPIGYFAGWSGGACSGTDPSCVITIAADTIVVATFQLQNTLTVSKTGAGSGLVTSTPSGLDCGSTCQATYTPGTNVTLTATPSPGSQFAGWSGGGCSGTNRLCTTTISIDTTVTADFEIFVATASMTTPRADYTATLLPSGKVLIAGGRDSSDSIHPSAELYDPATWTFSPTGSMTVGRVGHTATLLPNGKVLLTGGLESNNPIYDTYSSAELYDPSTGSFVPAGEIRDAGLGYMLGRHAWHTATFLNDTTGWGWPYGTVLIAGGMGDYSLTELYQPDPGFFNFPEIYYMTNERARHTATFLQNGKVLLAGGHDSGHIALPTAEIYDPTNVDGFLATGSMTTARESHTATLLPNGKVLIAGGADNVATHSSAELYDPATGIFTATEPMATPREGHTATLLPNGKVLIAGGYSNLQNWFSDTAELYDPSTETFTATGSMRTSRSQHTATLLPNGRVLLAGGRNSTEGALSSAEIYDPAMGAFSPPGPSITVVPDVAGDLLLRNCVDVDPPTIPNRNSPCSLPPGTQLPLPGYFDIKRATIEQVSGEEVELSISLYEPVPAAPTYPFVSYNWQFQGG